MNAPLDPQQAALQRALGTSYEIGRLLGRGGMGAVYLARETALERTVAIKVLPPEMASGADSRERFRREARTAAKLTHPNIVPLYTFGDAEGMLYFVMGYVRGESLGDRLGREGKLPGDDVRRILGELADALDYAHRQGVIHRDIKPDNVLLDDASGRPMLTDFGVAKARATGATLTEAGAVVGTPHYMSPEQASGARDLDGRSDLYALGVMGYQMLSGRLPFEGESFQDVIVKQVSMEPVPLGALVRDAPGGLTGAIGKCLAKDPAARWPDGQALREALGQDETEFGEGAQGKWLARLEAESADWLLTGYALGIGAALFPVMSPGVREMIPLILGCAGFGVLLEAGVVAWLVRKGHSWAKLRRLMLRPPRWWPLWWPARWRRPGDVWERLPRILKGTRIVQTVSVVLLGAFILGVCGLAWLGKGPSPLHDLYGMGLLAVLGPIPLLVAGNVLASYHWMRRKGLTWEQASNAASRSTTALFWKQRIYSALLDAPGVGTARLAEPRAPQEFVQAIADAAAQLTGPMRASGSEAVGAARQVVGVLAVLDAELAQLARDANPAELAQVEQKLAALGDPGADNDARRRMRALLESQRDLFRGLAGQLEAATQRRAQLVDLLRTLWLQVANLRAEAAREAREGSEVTGRIRAVVAEIARHTNAAAEVRAIAP